MVTIVTSVSQAISVKQMHNISHNARFTTYFPLTKTIDNGWNKIEAEQLGFER